MSFKLNTKTGVDYLTLDYEGFRQMMIDRLKERLPEYTDYSETDMGVILIELLSHGLDILSYYKDRQALECFLPTARERKNVMTLCKNFGYTLHSATPSKFIQIFETDGTGLSIDIVKGDTLQVKTSDSTGEESVYFEVIGSLDENDEFNPNFYIPSGKFGNEKTSDGSKYMYRAVVVQGKTINTELVGYSDGSSYQKFSTNSTPALDYTPDLKFRSKSGSDDAYYGEFVVKTFVGDTMEEWHRVDNFLLSNSTDKHFVYSVDEYGRGTVEFGNGISGAIPPENTKVYCTYRVGGGESTNVGAMTITEIENRRANILKTYNPDTALVLGTDMESLDEARIKAPACLRTLDRAVTIRDYSDIGLLLDFIMSTQSVYVDYDGVGSVRLIDEDDNEILNRTEYGITSGDFGHLKVWLMPKNVKVDNSDSSKPKLEISDDNMDYIKEYYMDKKMIGQKLDIYPANIQYVSPVLKITKDNNYTDDTVINAIKSRLIDLMKLGNYKLKEDLIWSDIVRNLVDSQTGVIGLKSATFVQKVEGVENKYYIADDIPVKMGYVIALKPKDNPEETDMYPYDIEIILS